MKLVIDLTKMEDIQAGHTMLGGMLTVPVGESQPVDYPEVAEDNSDMAAMLGGAEETAQDDDISAMLGGAEEEVAAPTVLDIQEAFKALNIAKGKDVAMTTIQGILGKLAVGTLAEIPEEKRETVIAILKKQS